MKITKNDIFCVENSPYFWLKGRKRITTTTTPLDCGHLAGEDLFGLQQHDYAELKQTKRELELLEKLYTLYITVLQKVNGYAAQRRVYTPPPQDGVLVSIILFFIRCAVEIQPESSPLQRQLKRCRHNLAHGLNRILGGIRSLPLQRPNIAFLPRAKGQLTILNSKPCRCVDILWTELQFQAITDEARALLSQWDPNISVYMFPSTVFSQPNPQTVTPTSGKLFILPLSQIRRHPTRFSIINPYFSGHGAPPRFSCQYLSSPVAFAAPILLFQDTAFLEAFSICQQWSCEVILTTVFCSV